MDRVSSFKKVANGEGQQACILLAGQQWLQKDKKLLAANTEQSAKFIPLQTGFFFCFFLSKSLV